jgi:hypothetical protein
MQIEIMYQTIDFLFVNPVSMSFMFNNENWENL